MVSWESSKLIQKLDNDEMLYVEVDGMWVFNTKLGFLASYHLRAIADEIDRRNANWPDKIGTSSKDK